eukprot:1360502-Amphidinium_carterae.1
MLHLWLSDPACHAQEAREIDGATGVQARNLAKNRIGTASKGCSIRLNMFTSHSLPNHLWKY